MKESYVLWASVALNFVLALILFFRTALNEILLDWYKRSRQRRDRLRTLLLELRKHMSSFAQDYFLVLVGAGLELMGGEMAPAGRKYREEAGERLKEANDFLDHRLPEFPQTIRTLVGELRGRVMLPKMDEILNREFILERGDSVEGVVKKILEEVDRRI